LLCTDRYSDRSPYELRSWEGYTQLQEVR